MTWGIMSTLGQLAICTLRKLHDLGIYLPKAITCFIHSLSQSLSLAHNTSLITLLVLHAVYFQWSDADAVGK